MFRPLIVLLLGGLLGACSLYKGEWPRLFTGDDTRSEAASVPAPSPAASQPAARKAVLGAEAAAAIESKLVILTTRLSQSDADLGRQSATLEGLRKALEAATGAALGLADQGDTARAAQIALSRYNAAISGLDPIARAEAAGVAGLASLMGAVKGYSDPTATTLRERIAEALVDGGDIYSRIDATRFKAGKTAREHAKKLAAGAAPSGQN